MVRYRRGREEDRVSNVTYTTHTCTQKHNDVHERTHTTRAHTHNTRTHAYTRTHTHTHTHTHHTHT